MSEIKDVQIEASWKEALAGEFALPYFAQIKQALQQAKAEGKTVYPPGNLIFNAFDLVPLPKVKVVILGQDPYHGAGEAHGLSFSVQRGVRIPPSLRNIYKALEASVPGFSAPKHGCLEAWAAQGVFLLNAFLTVEAGKPKSHEKIGWERFTDAVIRTVSDRLQNVVFMLWGGFAKKKAELIDQERHLILQGVHPSPLAGNSFPDCTHFAQANAYLQERGLPTIDWSLPD